MPSIGEVAIRPAWALVLERFADGRYYGELTGLLRDGELVADGPEAAWEQFQGAHAESLRLRAERARLERERVGVMHEAIEDARLAVRRAELGEGADSEAATRARAALEAEQERGQLAITELQTESSKLRAEAQRFALRFTNELGEVEQVPVWDTVRAVPANRIGLFGKLDVYGERWGEFLSEDPRKGIQEGGVFPAIFGTVVMTLIMSVAVVPFGVLAALYLREYARQGALVSAVRIAVNNLAGVPSIVFGVFGLGFFCYGVGAWMDATFYAEYLPNPTFGKGGLLWASLTLALLTLPVVIVATEEALAAVPSSMREGSYACGATKWQTIRRIVLPRALPGILTGMILAVARGAGEVAPLMLVGAVALAPELPLALDFPEFGVQRSFMHLGYQIYELGFKSPDAEAAIPFVYTTTLLLILIVVTLNLLAIWVRARLRRRYMIG
jgi:phosphate transport system permease protein